MGSRDVLLRATSRAWSTWYERKLPDAEFRTLLRAVRDDASVACRQPVTDDFFLEPERRRRIDELEEWSSRLSDRRLRRLVAEVVALGDETWAKTKPPEVIERDQRWTSWQFAAARDWLSAAKSALDRLDVLDRRRMAGSAHRRPSSSR